MLKIYRKIPEFSLIMIFVIFLLKRQIEAKKSQIKNCRYSPYSWTIRREGLIQTTAGSR